MPEQRFTSTPFAPLGFGFEDSIFDRILDGVWDKFTQACKRDLHSNRILVLADLLFRQDLPEESLQRLPDVNSHSYRVLEEDFPLRGNINQYYLGVFSRIFNSGGPTFIDDPKDSGPLTLPIPLVAYREVILSYLSIVLENDTFPFEMQLTKPELMLIRNALLGERELTGEIAKAVESKFQLNLYHQARLLLELYKSSEKGWARQEQKLFYEEYILNFGIRRRQPLANSIEARIHDMLATVETRDEFFAVLEELDSQAGIRMFGFFRESRYLSRLLSTGFNAKPQEIPHFSKVFPRRRWRTLVTNLSDAKCTMRDHISPESVKIYVLRQLCACFVVLRAHGETGFESFIDALVVWFEKTFGINFVKYLPLVYRRSMMMCEPVADVFSEIYDEYFEKKVLERLGQMSTEDVGDATIVALRRMSYMPLKTIAPGCFDFGAFVYDALFGFEYPVEQYPLLVHRLN